MLRSNITYLARSCALLCLLTTLATAQRTHVPGETCIGCHAGFGAAGTVFSAYSGGAPMAGETLSLYRTDGSRVSLPPSDTLGRIFVAGLAAGDYLPALGGARARTWHAIPAQADCNACHVEDGNGSSLRIKQLPRFHTEIAPGNSCLPCHFFPASMAQAQLRTPGRLNTAAGALTVQGSAVVIRGAEIPFDPAAHRIESTRPDIFMPGNYSLFDVLLTAARSQGIRIAYHWDADCSTHFIDSVDGVPGQYWYRFSYDAGRGTQAELGNRRELRWDELLYQPGAWVQLVIGENLDELTREYREEIARERTHGHRVPLVQITINPSDYKGNPPGSGRVTIQRTFSSVTVTSHRLRETGGDSLYRMPFRPGIVTAMDVLYSLQDSGHLNIVGRAYYTRLAQKVQESWRIQEIGFPGIGSAHGSGRQGFVYTTGNGTTQRLANNADRKQHVHADIVVLHAPDFALWRWIELGNPYYEDAEPTGIEELDADFNARDRGFRLQRPYPNPAADMLALPCNIFEPGRYRITLHDASGRQCATVFDGDCPDVGVRVFEVSAAAFPQGMYFVQMDDGRSIDVQRVLIVTPQ